MASKTSSTQTAGIGDDAVRAATGMTWPEWFAILDAAGAQKMTHKEIVAYLHGQQGVGDWWQQMVTVGYEQARGLRDKHETPEGYRVSASKTVAVPLARLYAAWEHEAARKRWLGRRSHTVRKATPQKSMRISWGGSSVDANFYAKGAGKSQVTLEHSRLPDAAEAARMMAMWARALERLKAVLEG